MISLFLVEDELISRQGIEKNVPWAENGINFLGSGIDGELAAPADFGEKTGYCAHGYPDAVYGRFAAIPDY